MTGQRVGNDLVHVCLELHRQDGNGVHHQEGDAFAFRDVLPCVGRQIHARLEDILVDLAAVRHAVYCQQRGFKRAAPEPAEDDVRVVGHAKPRAENAQIALQRRKQLDGILLHDGAHILSRF